MKHTGTPLTAHILRLWVRCGVEGGEAGPAPSWQPARHGAISIRATVCRNSRRLDGPVRDPPSPNYCPCTWAPLGAAAP